MKANASTLLSVLPSLLPKAGGWKRFSRFTQRVGLLTGAAVSFLPRLLWASEPAVGTPTDSASPSMTQVSPGAGPATGATEYSAGYDAPEALEARWYGWQTLATDGAAVALVGLGLAVELGTDSPPSALTASLFTLGIAGYALGGPMVHFSQGHTGRGFASLALRVGLPVVLGFGAVQVFCESTRELCPLVAIPGGLLGILTAIPVDAAVLARDYVPVQGGVRLAPTFYADQHQFGLGLSGTF